MTLPIYIAKGIDMNRIKLHKIIRLSETVFALWLFSALLITAQAATNRLETIQTTALGGGRAEILLTLDRSAPKPAAFTVTHPARLSVDLPGTALATDKRYREVQAGPITGLTLAADNKRTRLVVQLSDPVGYKISRDGNHIRIIVDATSPTQGAAADGDTVSAANRVTDIDFRRSPEGAGRIEMTLSGLGGPIDTQTRNGKVFATLPDTRLPEDMEKRLDVLDFATPIKYVDIYGRNGNTKVVVTPVSNANYKRVAYQSGNQFILELKPATETKKEKKEGKTPNKPEFTGEEISLSFQKVDIRAVLQIIADVAGVNMVVSESVKGQITLQLDNVPWDQALNIIMRSEGLGMLRIGNVITIAPLKEITQRKKARRAAQEATQKAAPLQSRIIQINYADAGDIADLIKGGSNGGGNEGDDDNSLLSDRGQVSVDARTNSLLITDTAAKIQEIRRLIAEVDIPVRQVLIESRLVIANRGFSRALGVTHSKDVASQGSPGSNSFLENTGYTVNLPIGGPTGTLTTSIIGDNFSLDLTLQAMEVENRGKVISTPRLITTDGQEALIEQGQKIPYTTVDEDGQSDTEFKEAVLNLTVTPHITPDGHVLLEISLTQDSIGGRTVEGEPVIDTRSLQTQVLVDNGNTVVLGGIYQKKNNRTVNSVPFLSDIPLIGTLFTSTTTKRKKLEVLIFITPKILRETLTEN